MEVTTHEVFISGEVMAMYFLYPVTNNRKLSGEEESFWLPRLPPLKSGASSPPSVLPVCVIALHSQMPLNIFDTLTNSPLSALSSWLFPWNVRARRRRRQTGWEDKRGAKSASSQMGSSHTERLLKYISYRRKLAWGRDSSWGRKLRISPTDASWKTHPEDAVGALRSACVAGDPRIWHQ